MQEARNHRALFHQLAEGNEEAYRSLFHYFTPRLQPFVYSIVKSEGVAEEIVQEVMLRVWTHREAIVEKENPSSWIFTVASNLAISWLRRLAVERKYIDSIKTTVEENQKNSVEERLIYRENEQLLKTAIGQLPPQQQQIYRMSRLEGLTHKEIAEKLGISPNTVKNHMVAAAKALLARIYKNFIFFQIF
ncbi:MAG: RNA polymerase sigma-70 factor [Chitinophagaceae bacterium]|nr:RNA polymerase sigma-70 factor [Chitinophagaceae bacterium]